MLLTSADLTATATLILAGITLALVVATIALVVVSRRGLDQERDHARAELDALRRQFGAEHRPLLVDVLTSAPVPVDMGAQVDAPPEYVAASSPWIETRFPGFEPEHFDPRTVFVKFTGGMIYISVPLRNVGRGLAVIDCGGVEIEGAGIARAEYMTIQRYHVPVDETTRIDLIMRYVRDDTIGRGTQWLLNVPYVDFAGQQRTVAKIQIVNRSDDVHGPWAVERVDQVE